jgi:hypothetical protein
VPPTIANGKVYMATFSNRLNVYGLLPSPQLTITSFDDKIVLSWPTNAFGTFTLQSSTNLLAPIWEHVTNVVVVSNGLNLVTTSVTSAPAFYRLKR